MICASSTLIRDATADDMPILMRLTDSIAKLELSHCEKATEADLMLLLFGVKPVCSAIIACDHIGNSVGAAIWYLAPTFPEGRSLLFLESIHVEPEIRTLGIAGLMMQWLARKAISEGCWGLSWVTRRGSRHQSALERYHGAQTWDSWVCQSVHGPNLLTMANVV